MQHYHRPIADPPVPETVSALPDDAVVGHADRESILSTLRSEAGIDHCPCVTAREDGDRYEPIYHSTSYDDRIEWGVVTEDSCDNLARVLVRLRELEESAALVDRCVDLMREWPDDERTVQSSVPLKPTGECYRAVGGVKGELGIYIRADATDTPARFKIRGPSFSNLQALPEMADGEYVPDLVATLGSLDTIRGEVAR